MVYWQKNWHRKPTLNASLLHHSDGWPLQYIWLIFWADWVREHILRGREQTVVMLASKLLAIWSPGAAAWAGSDVTKWQRKSLTLESIKAVTVLQVKVLYGTFNELFCIWRCHLSSANSEISSSPQLNSGCYVTHIHILRNKKHKDC